MEIYKTVDELPLPEYGEEDVVALKLHMGERGNKTHIRPHDAARIVERVKDEGAEVFLTDTTTLYHRNRATVEGYLETARLNGFTEDRVGCPILIADFLGGKRLGKVEVARGLLRANSLLVLSHATGHITTGFAGAIKNLAMGCTTKAGKRYIHSAGWPRYREDQCKGCFECVEACPFDFISMDGESIQLDLRDCPACERCLKACVNGGLWRPPEAMEECYRRYAETCGAVLSLFSKAYFINELNRITEFCDCTAKPGPTVSEDIGFVVGRDPVEIDVESTRIILENTESPDTFGIRWDDFIKNVSKHMSGKSFV